MSSDYLLYFIYLLRNYIIKEYNTAKKYQCNYSSCCYFCRIDL